MPLPLPTGKATTARRRTDQEKDIKNGINASGNVLVILADGLGLRRIPDEEAMLAKDLTMLEVNRPGLRSLSHGMNAFTSQLRDNFLLRAPTITSSSHPLSTRVSDQAATSSACNIDDRIPSTSGSSSAQTIGQAPPLAAPASCNYHVERKRSQAGRGSPRVEAKLPRAHGAATLLP
ncbi:hypothetical protein CF327_g7392 [Tilletia walkeri]|nr:hypothetical protein CF327_g7392 [Tilletia walkeri]